MPNTDDILAEKYGRYASFTSPSDPDTTDHYGDSHEDEVTRILRRLITSDTIALDLGCGGGQRLCDLASNAREIWGFDGNEELLDAARNRADQRAITNAHLVCGDTSQPDAVAQLPNNTFDVVYSVRGPFLISSMLPKLKPTAVCAVELYRDAIGLKEIFGRKPILPNLALADADHCISHHASLGFVPVSVKDYFFDEFYRDEQHLASYLKQGMTLSNWWMAHCPYDETRDSEALRLYARYNKTERGIRVAGHRKVYLFRRADSNYYPADPSLR